MSLAARYDGLVQAGRLLPDARQASCVGLLSQLCDHLSQYKESAEEYTRSAAAYEVSLLAIVLPPTGRVAVSGLLPNV